MAICGHQFHGGDESDWILSTSVGCMDGSTTASRILQELFKKNCRSVPTKTPRKRPKTVMDTLRTTTKPQANKPDDVTPFRKESEDLIVRKITKMCDLEHFDESQHLSGCPLKWLYNKKLLERSKIYKMERPCTKKQIKNEEVRKERSKNVRDKTPMEVKIHKINLLEKYTGNCDEIYQSFVTGKSEFELHRKKLAAKLNWKLHDDSQNDPQISSGTRYNYLPPRPLLGLKPLLSVLLSPHQKTNCCSLVALRDAPRKKKKVEASLSIQSLHLSFPQQTDSKPQPNTAEGLRWGSKSSILSKKLQIPNQITIKLDQKKTWESQVKFVCCNLPVKKSNGKTNQTKSLSSLFYELKGKTSYRNFDEQYFKKMIQDLRMNEGQFKIKRFLNLSSTSSDLFQGGKINPENRKTLMETPSGDESELNFICGRVRFFSKKSPRVGNEKEQN